MNKPVRPQDLPKGSPQAVTTGPIMGSRKVYAAVAGHDDIRVPFREVTLSDPKEAPVRVYDPSGPYTQTDAHIDLNAGLPLIRDPWIAKRGYATVTPRAVKPEDNGFVLEDKLVAPCPAQRLTRKAGPGQMVTQYEFAKAGIITEEMIYVAHRENLARETMLEGARIETTSTHGTGCTLASAIAAGLALGWPLETAVAEAWAYVSEAIRRAPGLGHGHGPLDHGWPLKDAR